MRNDLIEKVARAIDPEAFMQWAAGEHRDTVKTRIHFATGEARAAIAVVLKDQLRRFDGDVEIVIAITDYARENGVSLDE